MNELIAAAKAVIAEWDERLVVGDRKLRAAVERAENPPADFREWYEGSGFDDSEWPAYAAWSAAQQAERERIKKIITYQFGDLVSDLSEDRQDTAEIGLDGEPTGEFYPLTLWAFCSEELTAFVRELLYKNQ